LAARKARPDHPVKACSRLGHACAHADPRRWASVQWEVQCPNRRPPGRWRTGGAPKSDPDLVVAFFRGSCLRRHAMCWVRLLRPGSNEARRSAARRRRSSR
jgi:hypothetical protein